MPTTPANTPEPTPHYPVSPELLAWARQTFDAQEFLNDVREIEAKGGHTFESFIADIEARVRGT